MGHRKDILARQPGATLAVAVDRAWPVLLGGAAGLAASAHAVPDAPVRPARGKIA
jgi:hypothetical protein